MPVMIEEIVECDVKLRIPLPVLLVYKPDEKT